MAEKKLYRNIKEGKFAGVCAGIADYTEIDVTMIRLVAFLLILFTGIFPGLIAYIGAAMIMPKRTA